MTDEPQGGSPEEAKRREAFVKELEKRLKDTAQAERKFLFLGILNKHIAPAHAVLVGGSLVELYTLGAYFSDDLDLVGDRRAVARFLLAAGFEKRSARYFIHPNWMLVAEIPGTDLRPSESVEHIEYEGYRIACVSLEDAIVDRLLAAKFWDSKTDWEQAQLLAKSQAKRIDWERLETRAAANDVADRLQHLTGPPNPDRTQASPTLINDPP